MMKPDTNTRSSTFIKKDKKEIWEDNGTTDESTSYSYSDSDDNSIIEEGDRIVVNNISVNNDILISSAPITTPIRNSISMNDSVGSDYGILPNSRTIDKHVTDTNEKKLMDMLNTINNKLDKIEINLEKKLDNVIEEIINRVLVRLDVNPTPNMVNVFANIDT